jgi:hypothetical protein
VWWALRHPAKADCVVELLIEHGTIHQQLLGHTAADDTSATSTWNNNADTQHITVATVERCMHAAVVAAQLPATIIVACSATETASCVELPGCNSKGRKAPKSWCAFWKRELERENHSQYSISAPPISSELTKPNGSSTTATLAL